MESRKRKLILLAAGLMALLAVISFYTKSNTENTKIIRVVAADNIPAGTVLTEEYLGEAGFSPELVIEGSTNNPALLINQKTDADIVKGEQILSARLSGVKVKNNSVAENLPKGYQAIGIPTSMTDSVGGLICPGNHVIVNAVDEVGTVTTLAQSAKVIKLIGKDGNPITTKQPTKQPVAMDKLKSSSVPVDPAVVVLQVTPAEAQAISGGVRLRIVLVLKEAQ